jgi:hypothetical protein
MYAKSSQHRGTLDIAASDGETLMAIYRLIAAGAFDPQAVKVMTAVYEDALIDLKITRRDDPITLVLARAIVIAADERPLDPSRIKERALKALSSYETA